MVFCDVITDPCSKKAINSNNSINIWIMLEEKFTKAITIIFKKFSSKVSQISIERKLVLF